MREPSRQGRQTDGERKKRQSESGEDCLLTGVLLTLLPSPPLPHSAALIQLSASLYGLVGMQSAQSQARFSRSVISSSLQVQWRWLLKRLIKCTGIGLQKKDGFHY